MYFLVFAFENTKKQLIFLCICQSDSLKVLRSSAMVNSISVSTLGFKACFIKMSEKNIKCMQLGSNLFICQQCAITPTLISI